jgi:hypothetical protein
VVSREIKKTPHKGVRTAAAKTSSPMSLAIDGNDSLSPAWVLFEQQNKEQKKMAASTKKPNQRLFD